jgi:arylsulfatase A-like enzyme
MINWLNVRGEVDYFYHSENFDGGTWHNDDDKVGIANLIRKGIATAGKIEDSQTLKVATNWIDGLADQDRFFLGMNLQNTHFSYVNPPGGATPHQPSDIASGALYYLWPVELKEVIRNKYLNAVYNLDQQLAVFADRLKARNLWDRSLIVIVGDRGEAFHEHGFGNHSGPMYDEVMRTFVMIKPPKGSALKRGTFDGAVSHLDITATIPDLLDIPVPDSFQGVSILRNSGNSDGETPVRETSVRKTPVFMHTNAVVKQSGVVHWPWKLLKTYYPFEKMELYHLEQDPGEQRNLAETEVNQTDQLSGELDLWINRHLLYYSAPKYYKNYSPPK